LSSKPSLNDLQLILLATAIQRDDGSILPPPESLDATSERIRKSIPALVRRQLIREAPVTDRSKAWREEGQQLIGLVISNQGRTKIAAGAPQEQTPDNASAAADPPAAPTSAEPGSAFRSGSKTNLLIGLLKSDGGATLVTMAEATGWLPHTTRAALTGLRKKGHVIIRTKRDEVTVYQIEENHS
jgi:hypothetical protein